MKPYASTFAAVTFATALSATIMTDLVHSQEVAGEARSAFDGKTRRERFQHDGRIDPELPSSPVQQPPAQASTGFDNLTNGFVDQGTFNANRATFEEVEFVRDGLGPTYNGTSCVECHQNVVTGGASQVAEHRTGRMVNGEFFESLGGSLVHSRATYPDIVERVNFEDDIRTFRISTNTLGDCFV